MCFHISISKNSKTIENRFNAKFNHESIFEPHFLLSAFSKPFIPVITNESSHDIQMLNWGLIPHWVQNQQQAKDISSKTFNAKIETAHQKPSFKKALHTSRCLVLADGFFEWKTEGKNKIPHYIFLNDKQAFAFAGLWNEWIDIENNRSTKTFSILTQDANPFMANIHNSKKRQPVILPSEVEQDWLQSKISIKEVIHKGYDIDFQAYKIDKNFKSFGNTERVVLESKNQNNTEQFKLDF